MVLGAHDLVGFRVYRDSYFRHFWSWSRYLAATRACVHLRPHPKPHRDGERSERERERERECERITPIEELKYAKASKPKPMNL